MTPLNLPDHPFFKSPTRISRVYPLLAFILLIVGSLTLYRWQLSQINADVTVQQRDRDIGELRLEVASLRAQQSLDQSELKEKRSALELATSKLASIETTLVEKTNELIAKEKSLSESQARLRQQESQLTNNSSELEKLRNRPPLFSFQNSTTQPNIEKQQAEVKEVITSAYDYVQQIYGKPYLLNQITISFVDSFSIVGSAGEIIIENGPAGISITIKLKSFDKSNFQDVNTIIHEVIHGFHGIAVFEDSALEEGITVAATDAVMEKMIADGKLPNYSNLYLVLSQNQYNTWNSNLTVPADNASFYASPDVSKLYQLTGKAWMNLYREDQNFFKKLNNAYYAKIQAGEEGTTALVQSVIIDTIDSVKGTPISLYLSQNRAFNPR